MSIEYLEELEENVTNFIKLFADKPSELEDMNPLLAHINLIKALNKITPILKDLIQEQQNIYKELAQKENNIDINNIKIGGTD